ncbi:DUF7311 family protein [Natronobacterium gregoryi]|uniref:DUF7311 domain-containing protein n=2 Tax=Natronobacterium gregoryi TaxID=44930 RepID=L0AHA7_NATGS|nr:hypothetical protein [Natronobacterium gregoryi]AFZ72547.1 hypothetical protein Natgr_1330 [Natronobacterium gregoryi SP2]ELY74157.1 hypothetical protein C490_00610 [Natronobacterium gregoryi SP2]PLK21515.1 hypothetical protein CYV19_04300 [Natronobacterium gregoryi SP2]SFI75808.1 hypothetical protein SAMN05443661_10511 [Natronobacterium gregoryi]
MIRYVLAVLLTVALAVLSVPAIDHAATVSTERQLQGDLASVDDTAVSLYENEEVTPDGVPAPKRTVAVTFPADSLTSTSVEYVRIERLHETGSLATFAARERGERHRLIDAPIVYADPHRNETVELGGSGETRPLTLTLERDDRGEPVVVASQ